MATLAELAYIDETGYHVADYPTYLQYFQQKFRDIYGEDIYLEPDSQDGQLVAVFALACYDTAILGASVYNSMSPATAQGVGLSRNVKINGIRRQSSSHSTVDVEVVGVAGTELLNAIAEDTLGQKWELPTPLLIPGGGSVVVTAMAQDAGAVQAQPNTVNKIFTPTLGWQSVNNAAAATPGAPVETDAELRIRQSRSTANPSLTVLEGTLGAVQNVSGVTKARAYENDTGSTDGNGIPAHSISLVVEGGTTLDVAQAIQRKKTPGTRTYGTTSQLVFDSEGMPLTINFYRPTDVTVKVRVTIVATPAYIAEYGDQIKAAVAAQINSVGIGNEVLITKLYAPAYLMGTEAGKTYDVALLEIAKNAGPYGTTNIAIAFNELPICDAAVDVVLVVT